MYVKSSFTAAAYDYVFSLGTCAMIMIAVPSPLWPMCGVIPMHGYPHSEQHRVRDTPSAWTMTFDHSTGSKYVFRKGIQNGITTNVKYLFRKCHSVTNNTSGVSTLL